MKIAILGYGVVGKGVEKIALENNYEVSHILMREEALLTKKNMTNNFNDILNDQNLDVIVECIGKDEPSFSYLKEALKKNIPVITANKKMLVKHFKELVDIANSHSTPLLFSAACGGGIPFLPTLNNIKQSDKLLGFQGIINGTSNFILNKMFKENLDFNEALKQAQELGYAEANPSDDIDGFDTANKLILGLALGFNVLVSLEDIFVKGIRHINLNDLNFAKENNYHCCLLAKCQKVNNKYQLSVLPSFVKNNSVFYNIDSNYNCLKIGAENLGNLSLIGQGAGSLPTASNIIRDIQMLDKPYKINFIEEIKPDDNNHYGRYYLRTCHKIGQSFIEKDFGNNCYLTKKISLSQLKEIIKEEEDFLGEIIND